MKPQGSNSNDLNRACDTPPRSEAGSTLIEALIATLILTTGVLATAHLFSIATASTVTARNTTSATLLAEQKLEHLRSLTWGFDPVGLPVSDLGTDTSVIPDSPGGWGLQPSPPGALQRSTTGFVDHVDGHGVIVGNGLQPPPNAVHTRRWSIEPLPGHPDTLLIQVLVTSHRNRGVADRGSVARLPGEARVATVKARKAP